MSSISVYTTTHNAIEREYPFIEAITSMLMVAEEIIIVDAFSTDGTVEKIKEYYSDLIKEGIIKIFQHEWDYSLGTEMLAIQKNRSLNHCSKKWALLFDADEVIHEDDSELIRKLPSIATSNIDAFSFHTVHFYWKYSLVNRDKRFYRNKVYLFRNNNSIIHGKFGDDPDNHIYKKDGKEVKARAISSSVVMYHYGWVKSSYDLFNEKYNRMEKMWDKNWEYKSFKPILGHLASWKHGHPIVMLETIEKFKEPEL